MFGVSGLAFWGGSGLILRVRTVSLRSTGRLLIPKKVQGTDMKVNASSEVSRHMSHSLNS